MTSGTRSSRVRQGVKRKGPGYLSKSVLYSTHPRLPNPPNNDNNPRSHVSDAGPRLRYFVLNKEDILKIFLEIRKIMLHIL
jgi:hypothetical protein